MSFIAGLFEGVNNNQQAEFARRSAEESQLQGLEMRVLQQLAEGPDDEVASLAGAGLMEMLAGNSKVTRAKGLKGFLGETQRSSHLPAISALLQTRGAPSGTPARAGSGALPGTSPVEPGAPRMPAGPPEMPDVARGGLGLPAAPPASPELASLGNIPGVGGMGAGAGPGGVGGPAGAALGGVPPPPAPPEHPQAKYQRLYPDARQTAIDTERATALAKWQQMAQNTMAATATGNSDVIRNTGGMYGAPVPQLKPQLLNIKYVRADGTEGQGIAQVNGDGTADIPGGERVRVLSGSAVSQRPASGMKIPMMGADGKMDFDVRDSVTGETRFRADSNMPPPADPLQNEGAPRPTLINGEWKWVAQGRDGSQSILPGNAPPPASTNTRQSLTNTPQAAAAKGMLKAIDAAIKLATARLPKTSYAPGARAPQLSDVQIKAIIEKESGGQYTSYGEVTQAASGSSRAPAAASPPGPPQAAAGPPGFGTPQGADALLGALRRRSQGGGVPAPPPR